MKTKTKIKQDIMVPTHGENSSLLPNTDVAPLPPSPPELTQIFIRLSVHCWHRQMSILENFLPFGSCYKNLPIPVFISYLWAIYQQPALLCTLALQVAYGSLGCLEPAPDERGALREPSNRMDAV